MEAPSIMFLILLCIFIILMFNKYNPKIDIVVSRNKHIVLLWYNKWTSLNDGERTFVRLFEF